MCLSFLFVTGANASSLKLSSNTNSVIEGDKVSVKLELDIDNEGININTCNVVLEANAGLTFQEVQSLNSL